MATTTLVSSGRPSSSKLLSMVPVIDPAEARRTRRGQEKAVKTGSRRAKSPRRNRTFNIGGIPVRQSSPPALLSGSKRQILPGGRKSGPAGASRALHRKYKTLKYIGILSTDG